MHGAETEQQRQKREKQEKEAASKKRIEELAKPKDKWVVGKELKKLRQQFPHDRVLERMVE